VCQPLAPLTFPFRGVETIGCIEASLDMRDIHVFVAVAQAAPAGSKAVAASVVNSVGHPVLDDLERAALLPSTGSKSRVGMRKLRRFSALRAWVMTG
jgi:hypothetical protein